MLTQALHWDGYDTAHRTDFMWVLGSKFNIDFYSSFNTYGMQWEPEGYTFFVNGVENE